MFNNKGNFSANIAEKIPWGRGGYISNKHIFCKVKRPNFILKHITMINPVTRWVEINQYNDKRY